MTKFSANNNVSVFTKVYLFYAIKDLYLYIDFNIIRNISIFLSKKL